MIIRPYDEKKKKTVTETLRRPVTVIESSPAEPTMPDAPNVPPIVRPMPTIYDTPESRPPADTNGRPVRPFMDDPLQAELIYNRDLRTMKPKPQKGFWNRLKNMAVGALGGFVRGGLGGAIGGGLTGVFNPGLRNELWRQRELANSQGNIEAEYGVRAADADLLNKELNQEETLADIGYKKAQTDAVPLKLEITRLKNIADSEYKQNLINLGKQKADDIRAYREAIIELRERGLDQADERIRQLEKRIEETIRHNKVAEKQGQERINQGQQRINQSQQNQNQRLKSMKMAQVRKYAQENGLTLSEAIKDFEDAGYSIDE